MKKFFLLISAVMMSVLSLQATVITQELNLSGKFSPWNAGTETASGTFNSSSLVFTVTKNFGGGAMWYGTGASALDASAYSQIVFELASACSGSIDFKVTYDGEIADQVVRLDAGKTTATIDLNGESIKSISAQLRANVPTTEPKSVDICFSKIYLQEYVGKRSLEPIVESSTDLGDNWGVQVLMATDKFADVHVGDQVIINYTLGESDYQFQVRTTDPDGAISALPEGITPEAGSNQLRFTLNATDSANLHDKGIYINGKNMTINSVQLRKHAVLWRGSFTAPAEWKNNSFPIANASLPAMEDGNILCVHVKTATTGSQISFRHGAAWDNFNPTVHKYFNEAVAALAPGTFEFPITHTMLHQLGSEDLRFVGFNITIDEIYIAEGTPTNTKAAFLTVSDAQMATYVLPFNVPTLPEGVEAYTLTNNGDGTIWADQIYALEADKPVLVVANAGEYTFVSEPDASDDISGKTGTYENGSLVGTYQTIDALEEETNGKYNYVLQKHGDEVAFYQVLGTTGDDKCTVAPYRAYLSCAFNANEPGMGSGAPKMRMVFRPNSPTGVENVEQTQTGTQKVLREGQIYIIRNGVEYTINGKIVK